MRLASKAAPAPHRQSDSVVLKFDASQQAGIASAIQPLLEELKDIKGQLKRIADSCNPTDDDKPVGSPYVARRLGQTTQWVAEMARTGVIPKNCLVKGTGVGKQWKFHKAQIDKWLEDR
jgi:hypothetical protein